VLLLLGIGSNAKGVQDRGTDPPVAAWDIGRGSRCCYNVRALPLVRTGEMQPIEFAMATTSSHRTWFWQSSTTPKPDSKTANQGLRGLITRYCIVEGVKWSTLNLRGCCVRNVVVVGVM
jgi:hypothetical protein